MFLGSVSSYSSSQETYWRSTGSEVDKVIENDPYFSETSPSPIKTILSIGWNLTLWLYEKKRAFLDLFSTEEIGDDFEKIMPEGVAKIEKFGQGVYSTVFKVQKLADGSFCALKKTCLTQDLVLKHVLNEMNVLKGLSHPNIIKCLDGQQIENCYYTYLELGPKSSLSAHNGKLCLWQVKFVAAQLALVLEYLEERRVLHRDIKPDNILVDDQFRIKLIDFAFAKTLLNGSRTRTQCGSIYYMSPEVLGGFGYGLQSQWWAYGVTLSVLCFAKYPFGDCEKPKYPFFFDFLGGMASYEHTNSYISLSKHLLSDEDPVFRADHPLWSKELESLLRSLLNRNQRLRAKFIGVRDHQWFAKFEWNSIGKLTCD